MGKKQADIHQKIETLMSQNQELQARLEEAQEALRAISTGQVDALVVYSEDGERIYTLKGADHAYQVMVESIHEGAATLKSDGIILYGNKHLAEMLEMALEKLLGTSFYDYIQPVEKESFTALLQKGSENYAKAEFGLICSSGEFVPVLISASSAEVDGRRGICVVVTDLSEQKQAMAREKELQIRLMEQREEERVRIARNLHDGPLQDLIGLSYALPATAPADEPAGNNDLSALRQGLLKLIGELRNVCNELRPPHTIRFGLAKAIQYHSDEFHGKNPDLAICLELDSDGQAIPQDITTTLFRIYQECLNNVIRHAQAREVKIRLKLEPNLVRMEVQDDGTGFQLPADWIELAREGHLGLVGMRERAEAMNGRLRVFSGASKGTTIQVDVPLPKNSEEEE